MRFTFNEYSDVLRSNFDEETYINFSQLCVDIANNDPQDGVSIKEGNKKIREKILAIYGLSEKPTAREVDRAMRSQEKNLAAFEIIEDTIEDVLVSGWMASPFFDKLVETKNNRLGQKNLFYFPDQTVITISKINAGHWDMPAQRLGDGTESSVSTYSIGAKVAMSWSRYLQGVEDWSGLISKISVALTRYVNTVIHTAFVTAGEQLPEEKWYTGGAISTATHDDFVQLLSDVGLANGSDVMIVGTKPAISQLQKFGEVNWISNEAKADIYNMGRLGSFEGTTIVELPQAFEVNNVNAYLEEDSNIYVFPNNFDRPIKFFWEGDVQIKNVADSTTNMDKSISYTLQATMGCEVITGKRFGTWVISD